MREGYSGRRMLQINSLCVYAHTADEYQIDIYMYKYIAEAGTELVVKE